MTNGENGKLLGHEVMRALAKVFGWPGFQPLEKFAALINTSLYSQYEGEYRYVDDPDFGVEIVKDGAYLFLQESQGGIRCQLYPESETDFFCLSRPEEITFIKNIKGKVEMLLIGEYERLERVD